MIDIKELRVGAHVEYKGERLIVGAISGTDISLIKSSTPIAIYKDVWCAYIEPIPITEELLSELGFEKAPFKSYRRDLGESEPFMHFHYIAYGRWRMEVSDDTRNYGNMVCEYLHQAESFLYLTTKTELIKE